MSMLGQEDRQQERGVLDTLYRVRLPRGQIKQFPRLKSVRLAEGSESNLPFQTLHDDLTFGFMLIDLPASEHDQTDDLHLLGTK